MVQPMHGASGALLPGQGDNLGSHATGSINVVAAELFSRLLRLPLFGLRAITDCCAKAAVAASNSSSSNSSEAGRCGWPG